MNTACAVAIAATLAAFLSGCGSPAHVRLNGNAVAARPAPPAEPVRGTEQVWHLRAGLNVAALSCRGRGRERVAPAYSRLLARHRGLLASAYAAEQRQYHAGYDRHATKLYNRFALQRSPQAFCARAAEVANAAVKMDSPTLARQAGTLLARID